MANSRHQFVYNGDITDHASFNEVCQKFRAVHRFMIGRGALSNPFIGEEIKGISNKKDKTLRIKAYHEHLYEAYHSIFSGPGHLTGRMKGFWNFIGPSFNQSKKALKKILKTRSIQAYEDAVEDFFQQDFVFSPGTNQKNNS
ncbi:MAG: hypothetical protein GY729_08695 [Desulfobacteraceae bacterium]|nr:hypothetical protein [Desulfobacteraceae bacterium]